MGSPLTVDFYGPIAFRFCGDSAWAYLPRCKDHKCNVLTDQNDLSPTERHTYILHGPKFGITPLDATGGQDIIKMDWKDTNGNIPTDHHCYCIFQLPPPTLIFGLRAEWVEITKPDGSVPWGGKYARGLRFYYSDCEYPTITPPLSKREKLDASYFNSSNVQYRIEVRFHDMNKTEFPAYADAGMCSATMRKLFPPLDKWTVRFTKSAEITIRAEAEIEVETVAGPFGKAARIEGAIDNIVSHHPVDCGANILAFNDGGLKLSDDRRDNH
jgi:hypothetical protein